MPKLSPLHKAVANEYLNNGFNGQAAYLKHKPHVKVTTARTKAYEIMKRVDVQEHIASIQEKNTATAVSSRDFLILKADRIGNKAEDNDKLDTALKAVDSVAKLAGIYTQENQPMDGYVDLLKTLVIVQGDVNISSQQQTANQQVDITPNIVTSSDE